MSLKKDIVFRQWLYFCDAQNSDIGSLLIITLLVQNSLSKCNYFVIFLPHFFPVETSSLHLSCDSMDKNKNRTKCHLYSHLNDVTPVAQRDGCNEAPYRRTMTSVSSLQAQYQPRVDFSCLPQFENSAWHHHFTFGGGGVSDIVTASFAMYCFKFFWWLLNFVFCYCHTDSSPAWMIFSQMLFINKPS